MKWNVSIAQPAREQRGTTVSELSPKVRRRLAHLLDGHRAAIVSAWTASQFEANLVRRYRIAGVQGQGRETLQRAFVSPLLGLLIAYVRTGEHRYGDIYLDERLRYAPHQESPEVRAAFFREVLTTDEAAVLAEYAEAETRGLLGRLLADLHGPLVSAPPGRPVRLLALGDCLMNEVRVFLPATCRRSSISLDMRCLYFSALMGKSMPTSDVLQFLAAQPMDVIAFSFLSYEGIPLYAALLREADALSAGDVEQRIAALIGVMDGYLAELRQHTDAPFLVHNASGLPLGWMRRLPFVPPLSSGQQRVLEMINREIATLVTQTPNTLLIDEQAVARRHGYRQASSSVVSRRLARGALFHTYWFGAYLADPYLDVLRSFHALRKAKVLLVDFDNTLWDGVMGDGEVRQYHERQELVRRLKEGGLLLVAVSKNDPQTVRWNEMTLAPDDFVLRKISWDLKVDSIRQAAEELDLGLDSFVLIDDNPVERHLVAENLPAVQVLDAIDAFTWRSLERLLQFPNTHDTAEARTRTDLYRQQAERRSVLRGEFDYDAMMQSLDLKVTFGKAERGDLARVAELIQRTNQFNTTTIRYSRPELEQRLASDRHGIYVADMADKFGALGLVAAVITERWPEGDVVFDSFVMSCRAMGFRLEHLVVRLVLAAEGNRRTFVGRFIPTDRNTPARQIFADCGFVARGEHEWILAGEAPRPPAPAWFAVEVSRSLISEFSQR